MKKASFESVNWTYDEKENWCSSSLKEQSPINIDRSLAKSMEEEYAITLNYQSKLNTVVDTGYCVQGYLDGFATINNHDYALQQFHFHTPSEHKIDNQSFPLELHLLHQSTDGNLAVIAVLFEIGKKNETFDCILNHLNETDFDNDIRLTNLIPKQLDYYHYLGSLTTPPLTEHVQWYVFSNHMTISKKQLTRLQLIHNNNFRDIQPLNNRSVYKKAKKITD